MDGKDSIRSMVPWKFLRELEESGDYFDSLFYRPIVPLFGRFHFGDISRVPALDIRDTGDKYLVKAEIPGMKQEDIEVTILDHTLSIKGEKKCEDEVKKDGYHYCEVSYGTFQRIVNLPSDVNTEKIEARYEDGILELQVPKTAEAKPKKVTIEAKKKGKTTLKK